jgi:membrane-associated protease RseP (regulator of RpoE activity)
MDNSINLSAERATFALEEPVSKFPWVNIIMFALTCISTSVVGTFLMAGFRNTLNETLTQFLLSILRSPSILVSGLPFSLAIMTILLAHEMGHYLTCRYYGISASLPYFIPAPTIVGTMGAFIRIKSSIHNRSALLEVGIAGPIAGFLLSVPALFIALAQSRFVVSDPATSGFGFGEPLIFKAVAGLMGKIPPAGMDLYMHPIGLAAWFGFFATAINLLPVGQLDGGHISYALFGRFHKKISRGFVFCLIPLGIFYWNGWLLWTTILLFIGLNHPVTMDDSEPLSRRHFWLGWFALIMFILCFTPIPFYIS